MNQFTFSGRIARDIEPKETQDGKATRALITLAVEVPGAPGPDGKRKVEFINITAWNKLANTISAYNHVGDSIIVQGYVTTYKVATAAGKEINVPQFTATSFEFGARKGSGARQNAVQNGAQPAPVQPQQVRPTAPVNQGYPAQPQQPYVQPAQPAQPYAAPAYDPMHSNYGDYSSDYTYDDYDNYQ